MLRLLTNTGRCYYFNVSKIVYIMQEKGTVIVTCEDNIPVKIDDVDLDSFDVFVSYLKQRLEASDRSK